MLIFDQLKKNDPPMRLVTLAVLVGLGILFQGLWYVQVISATRYRESEKAQSFRTVRLPAQRGRILDQNGLVLAENQPSYNVNLYFKDLRKSFQSAYSAALKKLDAERKKEKKKITYKEKLAL